MGLCRLNFLRRDVFHLLFRDFLSDEVLYLLNASN
ncbi:MAG: hypothetical protein M2R45_03390 [Verrucomicrobia subdivision 3 bacterium]|nr:hypothetical protein [Limisphaerales bacterium]MCS1416698.1 hypothetical protein [Limisphaerales bacterium]